MPSSKHSRPDCRRTRPISHLMLLTIVSITFLSLGNAAIIPDPLAGLPTITAPDVPLPTLDVSKVLSLESSASVRQSQFATVAPIVLPSTIPHFEDLKALAAAMPIIQMTDPDAKLQSKRSEVFAPSPRLPMSGTPASGSPKARAAPLRVMIMGDSMTQGGEGDFTWRYRIYQWFASQGIAIDLVGPYKGTQDPDKPTPPKPPAFYGEPAPAGDGKVRDGGGYSRDVTGGFLSDSEHFSVWGRSAALQRSLVVDMLNQYPADLILMGLGFNDMGWFISDACGTLESVRDIVQKARSVNPNMKFVLANVPQRTDLGRTDLPANTDKYNNWLKDSIPRWNTPRSPVAYAPWREQYTCELSGCPAAYDGLHPNELGDFQIARAFSIGLVDGLKIGSRYLDVPSSIPYRPMPVPPNFSVIGSPGGVLATWDRVYGTKGYDVRSRIAGITDWSIGSVNTERYDVMWALDGATYEIQVRVSVGDRKGDWTQVLSAVAHPQTAAAPSIQDTVVRATGTGVDVTWKRPTGPWTDTIALYNVILWDRDLECGFINGFSFRGESAHIDGLNPGHRYLIAIETWNAAGRGFPAVYNHFVPGAGTPPAPSNFKVVPRNAGSAIITWNQTPGAGAYNLWSRNINDGKPLTVFGSEYNTCADLPFLWPGIENYELCVSAFNGNQESGRSTCIVMQRPTTDPTPPPTCPVPPLWCGGRFANKSSKRSMGLLENKLAARQDPSCAATGSLGDGSFTTTTVTTTGSDGKTTTTVKTVGSGQTGGGSGGGNNPTTTSSRALPVYTTFPSGVSVSSTYVETNTHDSSGHPVLAPWPPCWFCPPGSNGIVLYGIGPGIYPGGGPPPGMNTPFPSFTIDFNGDPSYPSSPSNTRPTTTTGPCTTSSTVSDCSIGCFPTSYRPSTVWACSTTCSNTRGGCDVSGTSRTTSTVPVYEPVETDYVTDREIDVTIAPGVQASISSSISSERSSATSAQKSRDSAATRTTTTTSLKPTRTASPDELALNLFGDSSCGAGSFVFGYQQSDIYDKCVKLPAGVKSYQFVSSSLDCNPGATRAAYVTCNIYKVDSCGNANGVGGGCGNDRSCQTMIDGATGVAIRAYFFSSGTKRGNVTIELDDEGMFTDD